MRSEEILAAKALMDFFGKARAASIIAGENPPDFYLDFGSYRAGVEVSQLFLPTRKADGTFGKRASEHFYGFRVIDDLNSKMEAIVPDEMNLIITMEMPIASPGRFEKQLYAWTYELLNTRELGHREERRIEGTKVRIHVAASRPKGKKIVGIISNRNTSADIGLNASHLLIDRIRVKSSRCSRLKKPIWLALMNNYWLADADTYIKAARELSLDHCFEKIFLISADTVTELTLKNEYLLA